MHVNLINVLARHKTPNHSFEYTPNTLFIYLLMPDVFVKDYSPLTYISECAFMFTHLS